jgi:hypothetical protein
MVDSRLEQLKAQQEEKLRAQDEKLVKCLLIGDETRQIGLQTSEMLYEQDKQLDHLNRNLDVID